MAAKVKIILLFFVIVIPPLSFLAYIYWLIDYRARERFISAHPKISAAMAISGLIFLFLLITESMRSLLSFIPEHWGSYNEEGEFETGREVISTLIGIATSLGLAYFYNKLAELQNKVETIRDYISETDIEERDDKLRYIDQVIEGRRY